MVGGLRRAGAPIRPATAPPPRHWYRAGVLDSVTADTFLPHRGTEFEVREPGGDGPMVLVLAEVRSLGHQPHAPRVDPFSLDSSME
jgi:hypothetical protein